MQPRHPADSYQDRYLSKIIIIAQKEVRGML